MNRSHAIIVVSKKLKLIRLEHELTQHQLANALGISKRTVDQIETGRMRADWTIVVAVCAIFQDSEILEQTFGDDPIVIIKLLADETSKGTKYKTMGGKVWWKLIKNSGRFRLQQNVISQHYRIIDESDYRFQSTFDLEQAMEMLEELGRDRGKKTLRTNTYCATIRL